jgi:hypothetical protein
VAGLRESELGADDVHDAALIAPEAEQLHPELARSCAPVARSAARPTRSDRHVAEDLLGARGARMIDGRQHQIRPAQSQAALAQHREGLRRGHLVHQVRVDVQHRGRVGRLGYDFVRLPDLLEHGLHVATPGSRECAFSARPLRCA